MRKLCCAIIALVGFTAHAKVRLPQFFSDNMVLQQQTECNIWGWTEPGRKVVVNASWDKSTHTATARKDGRFDVKATTSY